jgi:hypothetical protein
LRRGIDDEPFDFEPNLPIKVMPLMPRKFLGIAPSTPALLYHPGPRGTANHIPGVGEASLALVLASKAAQPLKSTRGFFCRCDPPEQGSSHHRQDQAMLSATHPKAEREKLGLSLSQIASLVRLLEQ